MARGDALVAAAALLDGSLGNYATAIVRAEEALEIARRESDLLLAADALHSLAWSYIFTGRRRAWTGREQRRGVDRERTR